MKETEAERRERMVKVAKLAKSYGCSPFWSDLYQAFVCGCADNAHGCDQQCSMITEQSARRESRSNAKRVRDLLMPAPVLVSRLSKAGAIDLVRVTDARKGSSLNKAARRWGAASLILCSPKPKGKP